MGAYAIRRLVLAIPTLALTTIVIFLLIRLMPGDIVDAIVIELAAEGGGGADAVEDSRALIERELGLDVPILTQYARWVGLAPRADGEVQGILQAHLGLSLRSRKPVVELIAPRLPVTIQLSLMSLAITYAVAVPIGIYAAVRQDTLGDYATRSFAILWLAVPAFWVATMVMVFPALWWGWSPPIFLIPFKEDPLGNIGMFLLPAFIMGLASSGGTMRSTRTWMLEVLRQDYIRTAWSKGLRERAVLVRHAFKNTLIPIVTALGIQLPLLIGGAVIVESIFQLPGMGQLLLSAILQRDYTVVSALLLISSIAVVLANVAADLAYGVVDPRIRYQ